MVFTGNPAIVLLPKSPGVIELFMPLAGSEELPAHVCAMTSHTELAEPPMDELDSPLLFTGSQGLLLRCEYENTRDVLFTFGTAVENEMCFMWLYYY
jgi:hypothetical protein